MRYLNICLLVLSILICNNYVVEQEIKKKVPANIEKVDGTFLFIASTPTINYEVQGTLKMPGLVWNGSVKEVFKIVKKRLKKQFPDADGAICPNLTL